MNTNDNFVINEGYKLWNRESVTRIMNTGMSRVATILNTIDYVSSMYDDFVDMLSTCCDEVDDDIDAFINDFD